MYIILFMYFIPLVMTVFISAYDSSTAETYMYMYTYVYFPMGLISSMQLFILNVAIMLYLTKLFPTTTAYSLYTSSDLSLCSHVL